MVSFVHYCPELLHASVMNFHADTRVIQGKTLRAIINAASINDMLCILTQGAGVERFKKRKM